MNQQHPDRDVEAALVRLADVLCTWERSTGRRSVVIVREEGGFCRRYVDGKPGVSFDISDDDLLGTVCEHG